VIKKGELLLSLSIALLLFAFASIELARGIPDPSEGWITDYDWDGSWNWGISSNSTGHWVWRVGQMPHIIFDEWSMEGQRGGGFGVSTEGPLKFSWQDDYRSEHAETDGNMIRVSYTGINHLVYCSAYSEFVTWLGDRWERNMTSQITM